MRDRANRLCSPFFPLLSLYVPNKIKDVKNDIRTNMFAGPIARNQTFCLLVIIFIHALLLFAERNELFKFYAGRQSAVANFLDFRGIHSYPFD
jgi:hypothetical protein